MPDVLQILQNYWLVIESYGETMTTGSKQSLSRKLKSRKSLGDANDGGGGNSEIAEEKTALLEKISLHGMLLYRNCIKMVHHPTQTFKCKF